tara:strand:+ start:1734 stop:2084 length:351 start_codon:yes stop_codon:yes gene_type:complete
MSGEHTNNSHIIITNNIDNYQTMEWIHNDILFNTLTDEHFIKLIFLQKIKKTSNHDTKIYIYLDTDISITGFNLNPKLDYIAKHTHKLYGIIFKDISDIDKTELIKYKKHIIKYAR